MLVAAVLTTNNVPRHCPMSPGRQKSALVEDQLPGLEGAAKTPKGCQRASAIVEGRFPECPVPAISGLGRWETPSAPQPSLPPLPGWREPCLPEMAGLLVSLLSCARLGANTSRLDSTAWGQGSGCGHGGGYSGGLLSSQLETGEPAWMITLPTSLSVLAVSAFSLCVVLSWGWGCQATEPVGATAQSRRRIVDTSPTGTAS